MKAFIMDAIEQKEIRGMSFKTLITIVISTITIVASVMGTYFSLVEKMTTLALNRESDQKVFNLTISSMQTQIDALRIQLEDIKKDRRP